MFVVLGLERRRLLHVHVTAHPTAGWTAQQMIEALPEETGLRYVIRDRDALYGTEFQRRVAGMVWSRFRSLRARLGRIAMPSGSWGPCAASAWIM